MAWFDDIEEDPAFFILDEYRERKHERFMSAIVKTKGKRLEVLTTTNIKEKLKEAERKKLEAEDRKKRAALIRRYRRLKREVDEAKA